jgi:hypothetical protein
MEIESGRSCVRGVRFGNMVIQRLKLVSSPHSGQIAVQGHGFKYTAKAGFRGEDSFSLAVFGAISKIGGSSTIQVNVSVIDPPARLGGSDTIPPSVSISTPSGGAIVSGSSVTLTAIASDNVAVAKVQFIVDGMNIGSPVTSVPYTTTWNTTAVANGAHTLYAVAQDTFGNYGTFLMTVVVENPTR